VTHTDKILDLSELHIHNHHKYVKWTLIKKLMPTDDSVRNYSSLENQSIRLGSLFYSEETMLNYIRFQKISFKISMNRLKYVYRLNQSNLIDVNLLVRKISFFLSVK
jgi:hypothetical protein